MTLAAKPPKTCPLCMGPIAEGVPHTCMFAAIPNPSTDGSVCADTLRKALELTGGDRAQQHGNKRQNHQNIADLWNAYFGNNNDTGYPQFTAHDVAVMMCLLKIARLKSGSHNIDNYIDLCGYAGIAAEVWDGTPKT